jgi:hypothetical protein
VVASGAGSRRRPEVRAREPQKLEERGGRLVQEALVPSPRDSMKKWSDAGKDLVIPLEPHRDYGTRRFDNRAGPRCRLSAGRLRARLWRISQRGAIGLRRSSIRSCHLRFWCSRSSHSHTQFSRLMTTMKKKAASATRT